MNGAILKHNPAASMYPLNLTPPLPFNKSRSNCDRGREVKGKDVNAREAKPVEDRNAAVRNAAVGKM